MGPNMSVMVFSVEYLLRVWSSREDPRYRHPILGRVRYALTPLALIDRFTRVLEAGRRKHKKKALRRFVWVSGRRGAC